jgi:hypothetical protein
MNPGIKFTKIWEDEDLLELEIQIADGSSLLETKAYIGHSEFNEAINRLETFQDHIHGGIVDIEVGRFGPEYASGAFHARLNFYEKYKIIASCKLQYDFKDFGKKNVASEGTLYFLTAPLLLKSFIEELREMFDGKGKSAYLQDA